jgi:flagellar M-ring protein FliF
MFMRKLLPGSDIAGAGARGGAPLSSGAFPVGGIVEFLKALGPSRLAAMGAVALGLVGFFAFLVMRFNEVSQVPLYTGLSLEDSASISQELQGSNIPFSLANNGSTILVDPAKVLETRMKLAEAGLPSGGGVGYEIFDKTDALGTTSFVQSVNALRALEGELARTIRTIRQVENARVHLVLPERQLFRKDEQKPTASIVLKTRGTLEPGQIRAIQHLAASAVPGLEPSRISVIDENGRLLAQGGGDENDGLGATNADDRTASYQKQVEERVRDIVESVVGAGRARVRVAAELDFNRFSETRDIFDPNGQVVRSTQTREEQSLSQDVQPNGQVTAGNQVPNANTNQGGANGSQTKDNAQTTEETVNYEISKTTQTRVTEIGGVKRLSVAVLVDGRYTTDAQGAQTYAPRPQAELDQISSLVKTAMGFDQNRGDQLQVVNLQFADNAVQSPAAATSPFADMLAFSKEDIVRFAEMGVLLLVSLLVLLFAVRPLIRRIVTPDGAEDPKTATIPAITDALNEATAVGKNAITVVLNPDGKPVISEVDAEGNPIAPTGDPIQSTRIEEAKAQGALQLDQVRKVGDLVGENPTEAAILIRTWLTEAAA